MTRPNNTNKPSWPYRSTTSMIAAGNGQWMKKHRGKAYYFGLWADPRAALLRWRQEWPAIVDVLAPAASPATLTVHQLFSRFLDEKQSKVQLKELSPRTYDNYKYSLRSATEELGANTRVGDLTPGDFQRLLRVIESTGPYRRQSFVTWVRSPFNWGVEMDLIQAVNFGPAFKTPSAKARRRHKRLVRRDPWTAAQVRHLLACCRPSLLPSYIDARVLRAAIYLGINGGYGPSDLCEITSEVVQTAGGMLDYARRKTESERVVPLWPETRRALDRITAPGRSALFVNSRGELLVHESTHTMSTWFKKLLDIAGLDKQPLRFYDLRRTHATIAAQIPDKDARKLIMGHVMGEVLDDYVLHFPRERLLKVTDHVRDWFLGGRADRS